MITCPICDYHYSDKRNHCPTCGTEVGLWEHIPFNPNTYLDVAKAKGAERARQSVYSPKLFTLID